MPLLRQNKRLKDGWAERQIPTDWLTQEVTPPQNEDGNVRYFFGKKIFKLFNRRRPADHIERCFGTRGYVGEHENTQGYGVDIWIQAASGGEAYLACELIRALPQEQRGMTILVTTWTRQGMDVLERECHQIIETWGNESALHKNKTDAVHHLPYIQIRFTPLDQRQTMKKAFDMANPQRCILLETEIWPHFMLECKERSIPLYIINGRMTKTSYEFYKIIGKVLDYIAPKQIMAITNQDMAHYSTIFPASLTSFMTNIKFDRAADLVREHIKQETLNAQKLSNNIQAKKTLKKGGQPLSPVQSALTITEHTQNFTFDATCPDDKDPSHDSQHAYLYRQHERQTILTQEHLAEQERSTLQEHRQDAPATTGTVCAKNDTTTHAPSANMPFTHMHSADVLSVHLSSTNKKNELRDFVAEKAYLPSLSLLFSNVCSTFLFASVREKEENLLASVLWKLYPQKKNSLFIVAPRHLHRVQAWYHRFYDLGMRPVLASEFLKGIDFDNPEAISHFFEAQTCVIWDIFGDLASLYGQADFVFVGGSFKGLGGQNFLEALAYGAIPHVGPDLDNFLWALGEDIPPSLEQLELICKHTKRSLRRTLYEMSETKRKVEERLAVQQEFLKWIEPRLGASKMVMKKILDDGVF